MQNWFGDKDDEELDWPTQRLYLNPINHLWDNWSIDCIHKWNWLGSNFKKTISMAKKEAWEGSTPLEMPVVSLYLIRMICVKCAIVDFVFLEGIQSLLP